MVKERVSRPFETFRDLLRPFETLGALLRCGASWSCGAPTKNTLNSCVAFYIVSGFRLNQFKHHFKTVRVTPLDNALALDHTNAASTPWVHFAGDASRSESLNDLLRYTEAFSAGEIFALHGFRSWVVLRFLHNPI